MNTRRLLKCCLWFLGGLRGEHLLQEKIVPFQQSFNRILLILFVDSELLIRNNFNTNLLIEALVNCPSYTSKNDIN